MKPDTVPQDLLLVRKERDGKCYSNSMYDGVIDEPQCTYWQVCRI